MNIRVTSPTVARSFSVLGTEVELPKPQLIIDYPAITEYDCTDFDNDAMTCKVRAKNISPATAAAILADSNYTV